MQTRYQNILVRNQLLSIAIAVVSLSISTTLIPPANAAPLTLTFNTTVSNYVPTQLGPKETNEQLPSTVAVGAPLSIRFSYEPSLGSGTYLQSGQLVIAIGGEQFVANPFQIKVGDNVWGIIDTQGRIADPFAPSVDRGAFHADQVQLTCAGGIGSYCGVVVGASEFKFYPQLVFEEEADLQTLTSNNLIADTSVWNAFHRREMSLVFNNGMVLGAYISEIHEVPETSSLALSLACLAIVVLFPPCGPFALRAEWWLKSCRPAVRSPRGRILSSAHFPVGNVL